MGLLAYAVAGGAVIVIGAWESLSSASESLNQNPTSSQMPTSPPQNANGPTSNKTTSVSSAATFLLISTLSVLFIINSFISLSDAIRSKDNVGFALQLEVISIAFLFLLYSVLGILTSTLHSFQFPFKLLNVIYAFAFGEEFLLFYTQNKDPSGIENRYYDLILVPIAICLISTILELKTPKSTYPRLARGLGLVLQGMWTLQMGFSFYSNLISNGCSLHERSRGNFTIKCKGHPEYHRGRAIATLQFNCYLALFVTLSVGVYSIFCKKYGINRDFMRYKPLGVQMDNHSQFTLDSDDEDDRDGVKEASGVEMQSAIVVVPQPAVNGYGPHP
ncbi:hypothetical protein PHJA_002543000 [Phtheirospermum japonicum]|uniref:Uncharacterized protein n=1 Tax=Phtheirospermum japonicum TaxID=374723 RepID=A0A830CVS6_9LAMI|nr:hypothetical protein PHJA_002543000 [Phtheirospermum japonicum]